MTALADLDDVTVKPGWWAHRFGDLPRTFWTLFVAIGVSRIGFVVVPFLAFWLVTDRRMSTAAAGLVLAAFGAGWTAGQPLGGALADRLGRKAVIIASAWASAGAFLLLGSAQTTAWLCVWAAVAGVTFDMGRPAVQALMTDTTAPHRRAAALSLLYMIMNLSRAASCVLGGTLAERSSWWALFVLNAALNIAFGLVILRTVTEQHPGRAQAGAGWSVALRDRAFVRFTLVTLAFFVIHTQSVVTLPIVISQAGVSPLWFGLILSADPLAVVVIQLLAQRRLTSLPAARVCAAGIAAVGVGLAVAGMGSSVGWFFATTPLWIAGEVAFLATAPGIVAALAPEQLRGAYFGLWGATLGAAGLIAPIVATALISTGGTDLLWACCIAGAAVTAAACLRLEHTSLGQMATSSSTTGE